MGFKMQYCDDLLRLLCVLVNTYRQTSDKVFGMAQLGIEPTTS